MMMLMLQCCCCAKTGLEQEPGRLQATRRPLREAASLLHDLPWPGEHPEGHRGQ